jgi:hypothetical protein
MMKSYTGQFDSSPNIIKLIVPRRMIREGHVGSMGETKNAYKILVAKPERKKSF